MQEKLDLQSILSLQRDAFLCEGPPSLKSRISDLKKLRVAILKARAEIIEVLNKDYGHRSEHETVIMEIIPSTRLIDYLIKNLRHFMRSSRRSVSREMPFSTAYVEHQPLGVIGIIAPWNYPFALSMMPLATAIAAGNRAMIKPSEFTHETSTFIKKFLAQLFPEHQVAVIEGEAKVGAAFSNLAFDLMFFTGSEAVGRDVMRAASTHLVPVILELGGKSPVIIGDDYSLDQAAKHIAYGKLANAGQTCIAPDYVLVTPDRVEAFISAYHQAVSNLYPEGPASKDYSSIISDRHFTRLQSLLEDAEVKGAKVIQVGNPSNVQYHPRQFPPSVVVGSNHAMRIRQEEIFGPILLILPYQDLDAAITFVNARPRALALYYFGHRHEDITNIVKRTTSGNITLNNTIMHFVQDDLPFGGVGTSGMGAYHGIEGFRAFSHTKGVFKQGPIDFTSILKPPFGKLARFIINFLCTTNKRV